MKISQITLLCEISGDSYTITNKSNRKLIGKFTTRNNLPIVMTWINCYPFEKSVESVIGDANHWEFEFGDGNDESNLNYTPTNNNNDQMEIFANLINLCQQFKHYYNPKIIVALFKQPSQQKAYMRLFKRVWPEFEYDTATDDESHHCIVGKSRV